jgi:hypothetical protein
LSGFNMEKNTSVPIYRQLDASLIGAIALRDY